MAKRKSTVRKGRGGLPAPYAPPGPTKPAYGSYDPALDQGERAANRGLIDLLADISTGNERALSDYGLNREDIQLQLDRNLQDTGLARGDYERDYGRGITDLRTNRSRAGEDFQGSLGDLLKSRERGGEDYRTAMAGLDRSYERLGSSQTQAQGKAGVSSGGALAQAMAKRQANQALDREPVDTNYRRFNEDSARGEGQLRQNFDRFNQDSALQEGRMGEDRGVAMSRFDLGDTRARADTGRAFGGLGLNLQRGFEDRTVQGTRAERENVFYGQDVNETRIDQAKQAGMLQPPAPWAPRKPKYIGPQNSLAAYVEKLRKAGRL